MHSNWYFLVIFVWLSLATGVTAAPPTVQAPEPVFPYPPLDSLDTAEIRSHMCGDDFRLCWERIASYGEEVFPALRTILEDPKSTPNEVIRSLLVLDVMDDKVDRRSFIGVAARRAAHPNPCARYAAADLLGKIGGPTDTAVLVALLFDEDDGTIFHAADALVRIGGERDIAAIDVWLRTGGRKVDHELRQYVTKSRDKLAERLKRPGAIPRE